MTGIPAYVTNFQKSFMEFYVHFYAANSNARTAASKVTIALLEATAHCSEGELRRSFQEASKKWAKVLKTLETEVGAEEARKKCQRRVEMIQRISTLLVQQALPCAYHHLAFFMSPRADVGITLRPFPEVKQTKDKYPKAFRIIRDMIMCMMLRGSDGRNERLFERDCVAIFGELSWNLKYTDQQWQDDTARFLGSLLRYLVIVDLDPKEQCEWFSAVDRDQIQLIRTALMNHHLQKSKSTTLSGEDIYHLCVAELPGDVMSIIRAIAMRVINPWWRITFFSAKLYIEAYVNPSRWARLLYAQSVADTHPRMAFEFLREELSYLGSFEHHDALAKEIIEKVSNRSISETRLLLESVKGCSQRFYRLCVGTFLTTVAKRLKEALKQNGAQPNKEFNKVYSVLKGVQRAEDLVYFVDHFLQELMHAGAIGRELAALLGLQFIEKYGQSVTYPNHLASYSFYLLIPSQEGVLCLAAPVVECFKGLSAEARALVLQRLVKYVQWLDLAQMVSQILEFGAHLEEQERDYLYSLAVTVCAPKAAKEASELRVQIRTPQLRIQADLDMTIQLLASQEEKDDRNVKIITSSLEVILKQLPGIASGTRPLGGITSVSALRVNEEAKKWFEAMHTLLANVTDPEDQIHLVDLFFQEVLYKNGIGLTGGLIVVEQFLERYKSLPHYSVFLRSLAFYLFMSGLCNGYFSHSPYTLHCFSQLSLSDQQLVLDRLVTFIYLRHCHNWEQHFVNCVVDLADCLSPNAKEYLLYKGACACLPLSPQLVGQFYSKITSPSRCMELDALLHTPVPARMQADNSAQFSAMSLACPKESVS